MFDNNVVMDTYSLWYLIVLVLFRLITIISTHICSMLYTSVMFVHSSGRNSQPYIEASSFSASYFSSQSCFVHCIHLTLLTVPDTSLSYSTFFACLALFFSFGLVFSNLYTLHYFKAIHFLYLDLECSSVLGMAPEYPWRCLVFSLSP